MNEIDDEIIKLHGVESVNMLSSDGFASYFIIKYLDGREIKQEIIFTDFDKIIDTIKETIIENSFLTIRKRKLNKINKKMSEKMDFQVIVYNI